MDSHSPSRTAIVVALGCLCTLKLAGAGFWDERVEQLLRKSLRTASLPYRVLEILSRTRTGSRILNAFMSAVIPGMFSHYVARKLLIEKWVREALAKGTNRLLVIGGGLDTLALRIAEDFPSIAVEEWDHPATQGFKRIALATEIAARKNLRLNVADLNEDAKTSSPQPDRSQTDGTICVIEGVLMYLQEEKVKATLSRIASICRSNSSCIFSFMELDSHGRIGFRNSRKGFVDNWLASRKESFLWGIDPGNIRTWLLARGWTVRTLSDESLLNSLIEPAGPAIHAPAAGEHLVLTNPDPFD
jgi:methyltransferase (TIGR00027 family)